MIAIRESLDARGRSPFRRWLDGLDPIAAAKVTTALYRLEQGNLSGVKSVGRGVQELKIDFGPGYRVYFGRLGDELVVLLGGGWKRGQAGDVVRAQAAWREIRDRARTEPG